MDTQVNPYQSPAEWQPTPLSSRRGEITFGGSMTMDEALQLETLIEGRKNKSIGKTDWAIMGIVLVAAVLWSGYEIFVYGDFDYIVETSLGIATIGTTMVALAINKRLREQRLALLQADQRGTFTNVVGEQHEDGLRFLVGDYPIDYAWDDFIGYRSTDDLILAYVEYPEERNFVAASYFESRTDWEHVKEAIETHLKLIPKTAIFRKRAKGKMSHVLTGTKHLDNGKWSKAIAAFDRALAIDDNELQSLRGRGIACIHIQDFPAAVSDLDRAIAQGAQDMMTRRLRSVALLGCEDYSRAITDLDHLYKITKDDPDILRDRGLALQKLGRFEEAIELYGAVIALNEQDGIAYNNRGSSLIELGRPEEAIPDLERAIELVPDVPNPHKHLARARELVGGQATD